VDTPRSATHFGTLVVCLPYPHQGGQLRVSHKGGERVWDWSNEQAESIKWAAFYSDCEHEVLEVQSGHRVTLTYNLYVHERLGAVLRRHPATHAESYPLYLQVKALLAEPGFLNAGKFDNYITSFRRYGNWLLYSDVLQGGTLGFHCTHAYAHTTSHNVVRLPFALKGVDVVIYTVFRSLGLQVRIRPVLEEDRRRKGYDEVGNLVGTGLHGIQLTERGGYEGERPTEVHHDPSASSHHAHHIGRLFERCGSRNGEAALFG
jgi:hypothetical protein